MTVNRKSCIPYKNDLTCTWWSLSFCKVWLESAI